MSIYINRYVICLYAYYNSGNLNEKSYEFTNQFYSNESKDKLEINMPYFFLFNEKKIISL